MSVQTPIPEQTQEQVIEELTPHGGYMAVLRNKNFLSLWLGQIFSQIADRIIFVVFITLIVHHFGASDRYSSYLYIAFTIPAIFLTAVAGVFVDRWPRRAVLVTTNLLRAGIIACLPWAAEQTGGWSIYLMAFLVSAATQFFVPAEAATIPMIVPKSNLLSANSLFTTTMMAALIFGFALGDPLINIFSLEKVHTALAGLFLLASLCLAFVRPPAVCRIDEPCETSPSLKESYRKFFSEMKDGIAYIQENQLVLHAILKLAVLFSAMVALCILFISFAKTYLYADPRVAAQKFAYIVAFCGVGMALGAFAVGQWFNRARRAFMVYGGFIVTGLCLVLLTLVGNISQNDLVYRVPVFASEFIYLDEISFTCRMLYTYTLSILMGVGGAFTAIPLQALLHELIPEDKRGKVLGVQFTILSTCSTLPVLIAGLAVEEVGVAMMLLLVGIPLLLLGVLGLYYRLKVAYVPPANW